MKKVKLPPALDIPSILQPTFHETMDVWLAYLEKGSQGIRVFPALKAVRQTYGQDVSLGTILAGLNLENIQDKVIRDILLSVWNFTRGRRINLHPCSLKLPVRGDAIKLPVVGVFNEGGQDVLLGVQARKTPPFDKSGHPDFNGMMHEAVHYSPYPDADMEICDLSAPDGKTRQVTAFRLSRAKKTPHIELMEKIELLLEVRAVLQTMTLPEKSKGKPKASRQGKLFEVDD